ncbi:MAG: phosphatase PAP2 family protein [Rhizomicrobium sp.]
MNIKIPRRWLFAALAVSSAVLASVYFIDLPLAHAMAKLDWFQALLAEAPVEFPLMKVLAGVAVLVGISYLAAGKPMPKWAEAGMLMGLAMVLSLCLTEFVLKPVFGRTHPFDYLQSGQYGFYWFHTGDMFGSFPSGHSDQAMSIASVLWIFYPRWRWIYVALLSLLASALMIGEWHFLSDIIAGGFIGTVAGALMMRLWATVGGPALRFANLIGEKN